MKSEKVVDGSRIDIYLESDQSVHPDTLELLQKKCPNSAISKSYVLEVIGAQERSPLVTAEFIGLKTAEN